MFIEFNHYNDSHETILKMNALIVNHLDFLILDNEYYFKIIHPNQQSEINSISEEILKMKLDSYFKKPILDQSINEKRFYTKYGTTSPQFDQMDVIEKMFLSIIEIRFSNGGEVNINSSAFLDYESLMIPSINDLFNRSELNIHEYFSTKSEAAENKNYIFYAIESVLLILSFVLVLNKLFTISTSFQSLMEIFTQFNEVDLKKIRKYCFQNLKLFFTLGSKYEKLIDLES